MIIMDVKADNIYCFNNFHMNMSYPKKIVHSSIEGEYLQDRQNFRYKKVNILMGGNATGKSCFGRLLMGFMNFLSDGIIGRIVNMIDNPDRDALLEIEFVAGDNMMYRLTFAAGPRSIGGHSDINVAFNIRRTKINKADSYEICHEKLGTEGKYDVVAYDDIKKDGWSFTFPRDLSGNIPYSLIEKNANYLTVLEKALKTLDPSIRKVDSLEDVNNTFVIRLENKDVIIQNGSIAGDSILSSGTKAGIDIAYVIASLICDMHNFYYCDELFSYVNSDVEKACLSVIIDKLTENKQLFFTTHNTDILDMNLPKHSYTFLKKEIIEERAKIICVYASDYLKKAEDSLKNAVENDLFCIAPELNELYDLTELF